MLSFSRCTKWALLVGLPLSVLGGCSHQGPGERCDTYNGSNDCDDGLVCVPKDSQHPVSVCCPAGQLGPESIVPGCTFSAGTFVTDSGAVTPADAASDSTEGGSPVDVAAAGSEAAADATSTEAEADGSTDATADSSASPADGSADAPTDAAPADVVLFDAAPDAGD
jgi:hypothetical protein